jgi:hypothetical protein
MSRAAHPRRRRSATRVENVGAGLTNSCMMGPLPVAADTLSFESTRLAGATNTVVRNGSAVVFGVAF